MAVYTHDSYTLVRATAMMREAVAHLLTREIPEDLARELQSWRRPGKGKGEGHVQEVEGEPIPFQLVKKIHEQLQKMPMGRGRVYLHELMEGSELVLPTIKQQERNPELVARLEKIRVRQEQKEYDQMVKNIDSTRTKSQLFQLGLEMQSANRQLWVVVNYLLTIVGAFTFGYFVGHFASFDIPGCVMLGLLFAIPVFLADLYFIVRTPQAVGQPTITRGQPDTRHQTKKSQ